MTQRSPAHFVDIQDEFYKFLRTSVQVKTSEEHCTNILDLPSAMRVKIWKYIDLSTIPHLRLVCFKIKYDIDHSVGLSIVIDADSDCGNKKLWYQTIGIKYLIIDDLDETFQNEILLHPQLLTNFNICGDISLNYFHYFIKTCRNIVKFTLEMNEDLLRSGITYFSTIHHNSFRKLCYLKYTGFARQDKEMACLYSNLKALTEKTFFKAQLQTIHISVCHKSKSKQLTDCHEIIARFILRNSEWLECIHVGVRESYHNLSLKNLMKDNTKIFPLMSTTIHQIGAANKDTLRNVPSLNVMPTLNAPDPAPIIESKKEKRKQKNDLVPQMLSENHESSSSGEDSTDDNDEVIDISWKLFPVLRRADMAMNDKYYLLWKKLFDKYLYCLDTMFLDLHTHSHSPNSNWDFYKEAAWNNRVSLTTILLMDIVLKTEEGKQLDLDLSIFRKCKQLKRLSLVGRKHETDSLSKLLNVNKLPISLQTLDISYFIVTPWQLFRLSCCLRLSRLAVSYCSKTIEQFGKYITIVRYLCGLKFTPVAKFIIIDTKSRFQANKTSLNDLLEYLDTIAVYDEFKESTLTIKPYYKSSLYRANTAMTVNKHGP